jgi:prolyl oligopeptidase
LVSLDDEVANVDLHGDDVYLLTFKNTPRYKVVHINLTQPDLAKAETIFPASAAVVTATGAAKDALYVQTLDGGVGKLWRVDYKGGAPQLIKLPYDGTANIGWTDQVTEGLLFGLTSWTKSAAYFAYNPATQKATDTTLVPPIPIDMSSIDAVSVKAKSYDGTMVPLVILSKKGLKRDGTNPTLMIGYGAYGIVNTEPFFASGYLPWLEHGGILALAGVRGGGEYGEEWHLAGKQKTKPNTWKDFIACAEYLINEKYTSAAHLAGEGGSAGGILIGNSIAERPDLFGAAIDAVGVNDAVRAETTSNGVPNIPEFGSIKTEEGFKALLEMDAYLKIKDGVKYPAVLLVTGINDPRVEPWMSAKMAARLQTATNSGKPVLLRVDYDAGHGFGSTKRQRNEQNADIYAFLFGQLR